MIRSVTRWCVLGVTACLIPATATMSFGQDLRLPGLQQVGLRVSSSYGELRGTIHDDLGNPLTGAVVSAHGSTSAFARSDREGRYAFRNLPPGPYLVRAHLEGYAPPRGRYVQVNAGGRQVWAISMDRLAALETPVLSAGFGAPVDTAPRSTPGESEDETDEIAWRLRHLKRSVLKDAHRGVIEGDELSSGDSLDGIGRAVGTPARLASAFFADLSLNGQINLLTTSSFDRPQDLFSVETNAPRPVAYVSVIAPAANGDWAMRGSMTQGDISSWILAGSFTRRGPTPHEYEVGASYATQRYQGGNAEALAAMSDGSRNAGELYASDRWTLTPQVTLGLGGKYATYAYLTDSALLSGRMSVVFQPSSTDPLRVSLSATHRELAPGAEEFVPPAVGLWLPPERTFSELSRGDFRPERLNQIEVAGEREFRGNLIVGVRAFRQQVDDQMLTMFGVLLPGSSGTLGHYQVGTAGDFDSHGWGASVTRSLNGETAASVAYTQVDAKPLGRASASDLLMRIAPSVLREKERIHDVTASFRSRLAATATRVFVVYKLNSAYADADEPTPLPDARFEVQVNQEMPFLDFTGAQWEMLVGVRNLFRSDLYDGSIYDELLVIRPPKRVMGGVTVRF